MKYRNAIVGLFVLSLCFGLAYAEGAAKTLFNDKCPISGRSVKADQTSDYKVEFCCDKCKAKFDDAPGTFMDKVAAGEPGKCIFSGKEASTSTTLTIGFCCGNCKSKFDKDPKALIGKVTPAVKSESSE